MAYSGSIGTTVFTTRKVIDNSVRRLKMQPQAITAEIIDTAKDVLFLLLQEQSNIGLKLWCIEKQIYPLYDGVGDVTLDIGTVDILTVYDNTSAAGTKIATITSPPVGRIAYDVAFANGLHIVVAGTPGDYTAVYR